MTKIEIPLDIPDVEIESVAINSEGDIVITVKSTVEGTRCHKCGRKITKLHCHDREITLRHSSILALCSDLYEGYINAAKEVFGANVMVVVDRFHIAKLYRNGLDELRKKELSKEEYKKLKGAMWILRKDIEELTGEDLEVLKWLFKCSPILELAYKLCNELTDIFEGDYSKSEAKRKINRWTERVIKSGLSCFNSFLSILDNWLDEIANYFINRQTSGFVEGLNNKIKVIKRRCYGIFNVRPLFQRIHLDLEGYSLFA